MLDVLEGGFRRWVEVDAQLVGVVDVVGAHGPGVEVDAAEVDGPDDVGRLVAGTSSSAAAAAREGDTGGIDASSGAILGRPLLEEELPGRRR